jgi:putative nucleotidyltransferase-like protein
MSDPLCKRAVLAALSYQPDFSGLASFPALNSQDGQRTLRWMDQSGLSLMFLHQLQSLGRMGSISNNWRNALQQRSTRNIERTRDLLEEFKRVNHAFQQHGVIAVALKGFTLVPDFCEDFFLRHQSDLDFLIYPDSIENAADALQSLGYFTTHLNTAGESCFVTPLRHIPSSDDDLYALQHHRQVDLHIAICQDSPWLSLELPQDCLQHAKTHNINGVEALSLSLEDKFITQVFHAFRHSFRSWVRLSWLLEIGRCVEIHQQDTAFWHRVVERAKGSLLTRRVFALVLGLVTRLFHIPIPSPLQCSTREATSLRLRTWLNVFAVDWAVSDWPGSLKNIFLTTEFIPGRKLRIEYCRSRMLPKKSHASLGAVAATDRNMFLRWQTARLSYVAGRTAAHLKQIIDLPSQHLRWKRALYASRGDILDTNC